MHVEDVLAKEPTTTPKVDQQTPNLGLVGSWSGIGDSGNRMYIDEEENAETINYLKNDVADKEKPFIEVVFKGNKTKCKPALSALGVRSVVWVVTWFPFFFSFFPWVCLAFELEKVLVMSPFFFSISIFLFYLYIFRVLQIVHHLLTFYL
jgi:hypothetical protein